MRQSKPFVQKNERSEEIVSEPSAEAGVNPPIPARRPYHAPTLLPLGGLAALTRGSMSGAYSDMFGSMVAMM